MGERERGEGGAFIFLSFFDLIFDLAPCMCMRGSERERCAVLCCAVREGGGGGEPDACTRSDSVSDSVSVGRAPL